MERHMVLFSLVRLKIQWPRWLRWRFRGKPVNIHVDQAPWEAEKRMGEAQMLFDERIRFNNLR